MLSLGRLQTLREVANRRSFSAAAEALGYTQSTVSEQVTTLERELRMVLVDRSQRPVRATPAGELVLGHADELLSRAVAVERQLERMRAGESGTLRVGGFATAWATFLPDAVAAYDRSRPDVELQLARREPAEALRRVVSGELDLAVVFRFPIAGDPLEDVDPQLWTPLFDDPYAVVLPRDHRLAEREEVALADLADETWVAAGTDTGLPYTRYLEAMCEQRAGFRPRIGHLIDDISMGQPLVAAGLAISLFPALGLVPRHPGVTVRPLADIPAAREVAIVTPPTGAPPTVPPMVEALHDAARTMVRALRDPARP